MEVLVGLGMIAGVILLVVLAILWFLLPFAVFGVKDKLDDIIKELRKLNRDR